MCNMKCTGADEGAGSGEVYSVHCAECTCSVQCHSYHMQRSRISKQIGLINI